MSTFQWGKFCDSSVLSCSLGQHLLSITLTPECIQSTSVTPPPFPTDISHAEFEVSYQLLGFDVLLPEGVLMLDTLFQLYLHQPQCVSVARWPSLHWLFEK